MFFASFFKSIKGGMSGLSFVRIATTLEALDLRRVDSSPYVAVMEDTKFQLKMWFSKHVINACWCSANTDAHELASIGRLYSANHYVEWESDVPAQVAAYVSGDFAEHC